MRFGKTLTALEVIRRNQYRRVIIVTHRPVVDDGWSDDFKRFSFPEIPNTITIMSVRPKILHIHLTKRQILRMTSKSVIMIKMETILSTSLLCKI